MDATKKEELKKSISQILLSAVNGSDKQYRTTNGFVRWDKVEQDIHLLVDDV